MFRTFNIVVSLLIFHVAPSLSQYFTEARLKAEFAVILSGYITWEGEESFDSYSIGVLGDHDIYNEFSFKSESDKLKGKPFDVTYFRRIKNISPVHVLYVGKNKNSDIRKIFNAVSNQPIFIITDSCMKYEYVMLNLLALNRRGEKPFELNKENIDNANLSVSEKILYLGGRENELREIYKISEKELREVKEEIEKLNLEVQEQLEKLEQRKNEIQVLNLEIDSQRLELNKLANNIEEQKLHLDEQGVQISEQKALLDEREGEIARKEVEISRKNERLSQQEEEIESRNQILQQQEEEIQNQEKEINEQRIILKEQTIIINRQKGMIYLFGIGFIFVMAIIFFIYRAYKIKKESNKILKEKNIAIQKQNVEITHQKEEILAQREQLELINKEIEKQNENIKASIYYANTIQQAILPSEEEIKEYFDAFSIYLPKDIVSGDFFWFARDKESVNHSDLFFIAVADCTGHGVPGGFLSMVGSRMLNVVINENKIHSPEEVLDRVDQGFQKALRQEQTENDDGMDIVLVCIERKKNNKGEYIDPVHVRFSGARRPLLILKHGSSVEMIKGDRKTIGGRFHTEQVFTRKDVTLNKGDKLYLTSDGITDQHSPDREKFGLNRLMQILSENGALTMDEQKTNLEERLLSFMKYEKQRDDITLLGIKL